jgi:hypothetical protein
MAAKAAIHATVGAHNACRERPAFSVLPFASRMLKLAWTAAVHAEHG